MAENIKDPDFVLMRTPLFPVDKLETLNNDLRKHKEDILAGEQNILEFYKTNNLETALYLASPVLHDEYCKLAENKISKQESKKKILVSLYKYIIRACTRSTPFGGYAGTSEVSIGEFTNVLISSDINRHERHLSIDMNYMLEFMYHLEKIQDVRRKLNYFSNDTIYRAKNGNFRYIEWFWEDKTKLYRLSEIEANEYIELVFEATQYGLTFEQITSFLCSYDADIHSVEVEDFICSLIDNKFLVSELHPNLTGENYLHKVINIFKERNLQGYAYFFESIDAKIRQGTNLNTCDLKEIKNQLSEFWAEGVNYKDIFNVNLSVSYEEKEIDKNIVNDVTSAMMYLWNFLPQIHYNGNLDTFRKDFFDKYEEQEVSLVEALDPEIGVGHNSYNLNDYYDDELTSSIRTSSTQSDNLTFDHLDFLRQRIYIDATKNGKIEVELQNEDLDGLMSKVVIPDSFYIFGNIVKGKNEVLKADKYLFQLNECGGLNGLSFVSRFCIENPPLEKNAFNYINHTDRNDDTTIFAEIVHLPQERAGNILQRPKFREYEIKFLSGRREGNQETQIHISDLYLKVVNQEIILFSKRLNRRIIPRNTTAHNYDFANLSVYKFLCDLQYQGLKYNTRWDWGKLSNYPFLPRVRHKNIILTNAIWNLNFANYPVLKKIFSEKSENIYSSIVNFFICDKIPNKFYLVDGDNHLFLDISVHQCVEIFCSYFKKANSLRLMDILPTNFPMDNKQLYYHNEIIIPLTTIDKNKYQFTREVDITNNHISRTFLPFSNWFFVKIYCKDLVSDRILENIKKPIDELLKLGIIDKWFFVRYIDTDYHLRLRFYNSKSNEFASEVWSRLGTNLQAFQNNGYITKIQVDTYEREIERYTSTFIELSESIFYYSSNAVIESIRIWGIEKFRVMRWKIAFWSTNMLLDAFGLSLDEKILFIENQRNGFFQEFGGNQNLAVDLNNKYRIYSPAIKTISEGKDSSLTDLIMPFQVAVNFYKKAHREINDETSDENIKPLLFQLLSSYIHMELNRIFNINPRKNELVIYHFLKKYYTSQLSMQNNSKGDIEKRSL